MRLVACHTRRSIAASLFKHPVCLRRNCFAIFDRSARSGDPGGRPPTAIDGGKSKDIVSIRERPAAVEDRAVPGNWEGDLLTGSKNSYIATWSNVIRDT